MSKYDAVTYQPIWVRPTSRYMRKIEWKLSTSIIARTNEKVKVKIILSTNHNIIICDCNTKLTSRARRDKVALVVICVNMRCQ